MNKLERRLKGIQKARRVLRIWRSRAWSIRHHDVYYDNGGQCEQMLRSTRTPCSCYMCGNPRRLGEVTRQEKKYSLSFEMGSFYTFWNGWPSTVTVTSLLSITM